MGPVTFTMDELRRWKQDGKAPAPALQALKKRADEILTNDTYTITKRKLKAPSGDPHDYMSMGPYWWPNPDTPDGLPYVSRDGYVNPEVRDPNTLGTVFGVISSLALAAFYFGDEDRKYSAYAERQLYDWFINPETKMNPNARFAQAIPGICEGRGVGLIDFCQSYLFFDGLGIFEELGTVNPEIISEVKAWYGSFVDWMLTSEIGIDEDNARNNHGMWYDAQTLAAAVYLGREELAKKILSTAYKRRLVSQIKPGGAMPLELARACGIHYTFYALDAASVIANIAERLGYTEYWSSDSARGVPILKEAIDFIYPYVSGAEKFPYSELHPELRGVGMARMLYRVAKRYDTEEYVKKAESFNAESESWRLTPTL